MKKTGLIIAAAVLSLMCGCSSKQQSAEIEIPILDSEKVSFNTVKAEVGTISETYTLDGTFSNPYLVSVSPSVGGKIVSASISDGSDVKEGDVLLTFASDDIDKQIEDQQIRLNSAKQTYQTLSVAEDVSSAELQSAAVEIEVEQNQMDMLNAKKEQYTVKATATGKLSISLDKSAYEIGKQISSGQEICKISPSEGNVLCASTNTPEKLNDVNFGTTVKITHFTDEVAAGTVSDIIYTDKGSDYSYYTYVINVPNADDIAYYESFRVTFEAYTKDGVVLVPNEAVRTISKDTYVDVLIDGVKVQTAVEIGIVGDSKTEIVSGLTGDEDIILS